MDQRKARDGKAIEEVGFYDTTIADKSQRVSLKMDRIDYWLSVGAQPSEKVNALIKKVKKGKFDVAATPPPMTAPKAPEPEAAASDASAENAEAPEAPEAADQQKEETTEAAE
jgi:small subunit ribosomal protein S16